MLGSVGLIQLVFSSGFLGVRSLKQEKIPIPARPYATKKRRARFKSFIIAKVKNIACPLAAFILPNLHKDLLLALKKIYFHS
jgi:hypothetical protein